MFVYRVIRVSLTELGGLSGARVDMTKRGCASVKCRKLGDFPLCNSQGWCTMHHKLSNRLGLLRNDLQVGNVEGGRWGLNQVTFQMVV
jgi:hypothetical protein